MASTITAMLYTADDRCVWASYDAIMHRAGLMLGGISDEGDSSGRVSEDAGNHEVERK